MACTSSEPVKEDLEMEQSVTEKPLSQDQQFNQRSSWHAGVLDTCGAKFQEEPSQSWCPRRQTGWSSTYMPRGSFECDNRTQDKGQLPVCRDFLRGKCSRESFCKYQHSDSGVDDEFRFRMCFDNLQGRCTYGASCKFRHSETDKHDGFGSNVAKSGTSKFGGRNTDDLRRPFCREHRSRSPCRRFQSGRCFRGMACPHPHSEGTAYIREPQHRFANRARSPGFEEGNRENSGRAPQEHGEANKGNDLNTRTFSGEYRRRSPCRNFLRGRCYHGETCHRLHSELTGSFRSRYDWSAEHNKGPAATSENPHIGGPSRISQEQEHAETSKGNNLRSLSFQRDVCRNFLYRECLRGDSCPYLHPLISASTQEQEHTETSKGNNLRALSFRRDSCRNFLYSKCLRGDSCPYLHPLMSDRRRYDSSTQQHEGFAGTPSKPVFGEGNMDITLRTSPQYDKLKSNGLPLSQDTSDGRHFSGNDRTNSGRNGTCYMKDVMHPGFNRANMDVFSRSWFPERQRGRPLEVCLKFCQGKCERGESCRYLHGFHEYAKSIPDWDKQSHFKPSAASACQEHDNVKNDGKQLSELKHSESCLIPQVGSFDEKTVRQSGDDTVEPKVLDQKGEELAMDQKKCEISDGANVSSSDFVEADDNLNLWSPPFKRRRSRSRSPFCPRDAFGYRSIRRDEFQNRFPRDGHRNVAVFRYPCRRSYQYSRPRYYNDDHLLEKVAATSVASCSQDVKDSNLKETDAHDKVISHGMQLNQCAGGSLDSNTEILNQESEAELAKGSVEPVNVKSEIKVSKVGAPSDDSSCHEIKEDSGLTESLGNVKVMGQEMQWDQCHCDSFVSDTAFLNLKKSDTECANGNVIMSFGKHYGEGLASGSGEIDISEGKNATDSARSCENNCSYGEEVNVSVLDGDSNNAEVNINLSERGEKSETSRTYSRKMRGKGHCKCCVETMKKEPTDPQIQCPSGRFAGETSLGHHDIVSVAESSEVNKSAAKNSYMENALMIGPPVQQLEHENGVINNKTLNDVDPAPAVMENGAILVRDSDNHSMQTSNSLKAAISSSKRKLLILDVNGLLADIVADFPGGYTPDTVVSMKAVFKRPFCDDFLEFCFERFDVGVWSSRNKKNVDRVVDFLLGDTKKRLLFCWDQSHCTETGYKTVENRDKPLVLKELRKLWEKQVADLPWEEGYYNETNTVLLDDSPYKALRNPPYTAVFPYPYKFKDAKDKSLGPGGDLRVYLEKLAAADNVQNFIQENPFGQRPITKSNLSWAFYSKIVAAPVSQTEAMANETPAASCTTS